MNTGMELMGMKECRECGDPYTVAEGDTGVCGGCVMGRELTALRAQLEAVTRERDALLDERRLVALELGCGLRVPLPGRLADVAAHFVAQVRIGEARLTRERDEAQAVLRKCHEVAWPRGGDLNGDPVCDLMLMRGTFQAHITTLERERDGYHEALEVANAAAKTNAEERDEARADAAGLRQKLDDATAPCHGLGCGRCADCVSLARADAARLREALEDVRDDIGVMRTSAHADAVEACGANAESTIAAALASVPSAEPAPRDMRVAEAVAAEAATIVRHPSGPEGEDGYSLDDLAQRIEDLDLAAVVAKAAKAVKP